MPALDRAGLRAVCEAAGFRGQSLDVMVAVALAESGGAYGPDSQSRIPDPTGPNGREDSWGPFQIHLPAHPTVSRTCATEPACAAVAAYAISGAGTNFGPWTEFGNGGYRSFMPGTPGAGGMVPPGGTAGAGQTGGPAYVATVTRTLIARLLTAAGLHEGADFTFGSGYRTAAEQAALGGSPDSFHVKGQAWDMSGPSLRRIFDALAPHAGPAGIVELFEAPAGPALKNGLPIANPEAGRAPHVHVAAAIVAVMGEAGAGIGGTVTGALPAVIDPLAAVGRFFTSLLEGKTWLRVLEIVGGALAVIVGLVMVARDLGGGAGKVASAVSKLTPGG